jgi:hypothetical protein
MDKISTYVDPSLPFDKSPRVCAATCKQLARIDLLHDVAQPRARRALLNGLNYQKRDIYIRLMHVQFGLRTY